MDRWKKIITTHRLTIFLSIFYFLLHLTNLTLLPIFNDESIYLDWGWFHTHMPGHLYDSLIDAKQPLMIWIFGLFENFFADPLFAGRFVSVLVGFMTLLGIYKLSTKVTNRHVALVASLIYAITPIFVFYNRQALLDSGIACVGVWACVSVINAIKSPTTKNSIMLGSILGLGFFIKSSSLLFIVSATIILLIAALKKRQIALFRVYGIALITFFCMDFLLFINPVFWETFSSNSRYSFTLSELFEFPFLTWINNLSGGFEVGFVFITPFVFLASFFGIYLMKKKRVKNSTIFLCFFFCALVLEILSAKIQSQRYLVSFLPFFIIPASYAFSLLWNGARWKKIIVVISCLFPFLLTLFLISDPEAAISQTAKLSHYADTGYISGQTSGHGIQEAMMYIKEHSQNQPAMVLFGFTIGNPESAIDVYSLKTVNLAPMHIDSQMFAGINEYQCLTSQYPVFFVTRNDQRVGMDRYFVLEKTFPNPNSAYSVRIYTLKKDCNGKSTSLSDIYLPTMNKIFQMKQGRYN